MLIILLKEEVVPKIPCNFVKIIISTNHLSHEMKTEESFQEMLVLTRTKDLNLQMGGVRTGTFKIYQEGKGSDFSPLYQVLWNVLSIQVQGHLKTKSSEYFLNKFVQ